MRLWAEWYRCVRQLRTACSRSRTFLWLVMVLVALSTRLDLAGVTSFVRTLGLHPAAYRRLLHLFHTTAVNLTRVRLVLKLFRPLTAGGYLVCLADGLRAPKEGRKMPAVKSLHQTADSNSKPPFWCAPVAVTSARCPWRPGSTTGWCGPTATSAPCWSGW